MRTVVIISLLLKIKLSLKSMKQDMLYIQKEIGKLPTVIGLNWEGGGGYNLTVQQGKQLLATYS